MAAAHSMPIGGAIFALQVLRGTLSFRLVIPALAAALISAGTVTFIIPNPPTYSIPAYDISAGVIVWALIAAPSFGLFSFLFVPAIAWADRKRPKDWLRFFSPVVVLTIGGLAPIPFPQVLGNGKDITQVLFSEGGFLGSTLGQLWVSVWPGTQPGLFALIGAGATLAVTTQGPISTVILMMELTGQDRVFILPMLITVVATLIARSIERRSIYEARLSDQDVAERLQARKPKGHRGS